MNDLNGYAIEDLAADAPRGARVAAHVHAL